MTRAEEKALKRYPDDMGTLNTVKYLMRAGYVDGYKQGEKDTIIRAMNWLLDNLHLYSETERTMTDMVIADFREAMEKQL